ncbi:hypothetical protein M8C21_006693, partial [Ambrosia artemisiifolia]
KKKNIESKPFYFFNHKPLNNTPFNSIPLIFNSTKHHQITIMCSSSSSTPIFFPLHIPCTNHHFIKLSYPFPSPRKQKIISLSSSLTQDNIQLSWASSDRQNIQDYNGWAFVEDTVGSKKQTKGLPTFVLFGIGTSVVALLAVFARFTLSRKGFVLRFSGPFHVSVENKSLGSEDGLNVDQGFDEPLIENVDEEVDVIAKEVTGHGKWEEGKPGRVVVPVSADATQQEALSWLKNLKIIEDEVKADELCTRREYARWLVLVNSRLERNPRHRILPSVALAGSTANAFNDISAEDPDFEYIQALAEAGVVLSKLSSEDLTSDLGSKTSGEVNFFPERLISREDLIGWRAKLEYQVMPGLNEEILRKKIGFLDARELKSDVLAVLFRDMLTNEKSIMRKVFGYIPSLSSLHSSHTPTLFSNLTYLILYISGQIKRFQPGKPCTKAQAAVALTSGRMTESIRHEFSKLEAENLKEELDEMNQRIAYERAGYVDEEHKIRRTVRELEVKYEKVLDSRSILEAELEALRILRYT